MKNFYLTFLFACIIGIVQAQIPTNGLVGYWSFTGNTNDLSGNNNHGTLYGATLTSDRFGNLNSAYQFNGSSDYIDCGSGNSFALNSLSISLWFKESGSQTDGEGVLISKSTDAVGEIGYRVGFLNSGNVQFTWSRMGVTQSGTGFVEGIHQANQWSHVVAIKSNDSLLLYVDGILTETVAGMTSVFNTTNPFLIGKSAVMNRYFNGIIDDIRIYDHAINSSNVIALYNEGICYQTLTVTDTLIINANLTHYNPITFENTIKIYPNPTIDHIFINNGNFTTMSDYKIKITNSLGQEMFNEFMTQQEFYIDLNGWTGNGIYIVYLIDSTGNTIDVRKIVLQ